MAYLPGGEADATKSTGRDGLHARAMRETSADDRRYHGGVGRTQRNNKESEEVGKCARIKHVDTVENMQ